MELDKQKLLLQYLVSSQELFTKTQPILNATYFDPRIKPTIAFVQQYFDTYKAPPTPEQVKAETGLSVEVKPLTKQETAYAEAELEKFCKEKAIEKAIMASPKLLEEGKFGDIEKLIRDAITVGMTRNIGLDYFLDPELRLKNFLLENAAIPTLWHELDKNLGGGLNRKEMIVFAAPSGVGKSITMSNLARHLVMQALHGVYITLELAEEVVGKRFDSMFSGLGQLELTRHITKASVEIKLAGSTSGKLHIKRMPESSTNANHIRAYLKEYEIIHGRAPDFVVVDYLDLMASVQSVGVENTFIRDKFIAEELRAIANDYNLVMITASQLNRGAQSIDSVDDLNQGHIAGGISKINTTDNLVAIVQSETMKARGEMCYKLLKTRSSAGVGNVFYLQFDQVSLRITDQLAAEENKFSRRIQEMNKRTPSKAPDATTPPKAGPSGPSLPNLPFQV